MTSPPTPQLRDDTQKGPPTRARFRQDVKTAKSADVATIAKGGQFGGITV
jgi:hypothetical protein